MNKMKKYLLCILGMLSALVSITSCQEANEIEKLYLTRCWQLSSVYGAAADVNLFVDFDEDGKFVICQLTDGYTYAVFKGTYTTTVDGDKSVLSGVYDDGTPWVCDYTYVVDSTRRELILESVDSPSVTSVYVPAEMPDYTTRGVGFASANIVKPL